MKVILLADVAKLGKKNDVITVNDGYAKNFLIKQHLAVSHTASAATRLNKDLAADQQVRERAVADAFLLKQKIENLEFIFYLNSNQGHAFGAISSKQLLDKINETEKLVTKYMLKTEHQWGLGKHLVELQLHKEVTAKLKIKVMEQ